MNSKEVTLEAKGLTIGYAAKRQNRLIADKLYLKLKPGRFVCLLGPNGTGKSTLIRTLGGLQPSLAGKVLLNNTPIEDLEPRDRAKMVSLVLTDMLPVGIFSVFSFVALGRHPHTRWNGSLTEIDHEKIDWSIKAAKADSLTERHVGELSDGERQKVLMARALAQGSPIMLLDEPTAFLDIVRRIELIHTLRNLAHQESMSILLSSHDLELALQCADELWLLSEDGSISTGSPEHLALTGKLNELFGSEALDWDSSQGSFQARQKPCLHARLSGEGPEYLWTQRALKRLGYGLSETEPAYLEIKISTHPSTNKWTVTFGKDEVLFESLESFTNWLERKSKTEPI
ncbi:MAG: ABC transporter ATP-binding protein [Verrucomicrobia bacterium]|nr:ABC transporter ATP-binding protein [Verrucomicrobiota bacterium]MDA1067822.1 ABC transporter ATP-binding protein [Verrucomicrobiota bacterium]